jgi:hypothetical protein
MAKPPFSTALHAYSTWKTFPSGEYVVVDKSYPVPIPDIIVEETKYIYYVISAAF